MALEVIYTPQPRLALILDGISKHINDRDHRPVPYQIGLHAEFFARLIETHSKAMVDKVINDIFDMGMLNWRKLHLDLMFNGDENKIDALVHECCEAEREGETVQ